MTGERRRCDRQREVLGVEGLAAEPLPEDGGAGGSDGLGTSRVSLSRRRYGDRSTSLCDPVFTVVPLLGLVPVMLLIRACAKRLPG